MNRIVINSSIRDSWLWRNPERLQWWLDLCFMASEGEHTGDVLVSERMLSKRWDKSRGAVRSYLDKLEQDGYIERRTECVCVSLSCADEVAENGATFASEGGLNSGLNAGLKSGLKSGILGGLKTDELAHQEETENQNVTPQDEGGQKPTLQTGLKTGLNAGLKSGLQTDELPNTQPSQNAPAQPQENAASTVDVDVERFVSFFNEEITKNNSNIKRLEKKTPKRADVILARAAEHGKQALAEVVRFVTETPAYNGDNGTGFIATFDWIMKPDNFRRLMNKETDITDTKKKRKKGDRLTPEEEDAYAEENAEPQYKDIYKEWLAYHRKRSKTYCRAEIGKNYEKFLLLAQGNPTLAQAVVNNSIENNWQGLFALDEKELRVRLGAQQAQVPIKPTDGYALKEAYEKWAEYKRKSGDPLQPASQQTCYEFLQQLSDDDPEKAMAVVNQCIANNCRGLYPLKQNTKTKKEEPKTDGWYTRLQNAGKPTEPAKNRRTVQDADFTEIAD